MTYDFSEGIINQILAVCMMVILVLIIYLANPSDKSMHTVLLREKYLHKTWRERSQSKIKNNISLTFAPQNYNKVEFERAAKICIKTPCECHQYNNGGISYHEAHVRRGEQFFVNGTPLKDGYSYCLPKISETAGAVDTISKLAPWKYATSIKFDEKTVIDKHFSYSANPCSFPYGSNRELNYLFDFQLENKIDLLKPDNGTLFLEQLMQDGLPRYRCVCNGTDSAGNLLVSIPEFPDRCFSDPCLRYTPAVHTIRNVNIGLSRNSNRQYSCNCNNKSVTGSESTLIKHEAADLDHGLSIDINSALRTCVFVHLSQQTAETLSNDNIASYSRQCEVWSGNAGDAITALEHYPYFEDRPIVGLSDKLMYRNAVTVVPVYSSVNKDMLGSEIVRENFSGLDMYVALSQAMQIKIGIESDKEFAATAVNRVTKQFLEVDEEGVLALLWDRLKGSRNAILERSSESRRIEFQLRLLMIASQWVVEYISGLMPNGPIVYKNLFPALPMPVMPLNARKNNWPSVSPYRLSDNNESKYFRRNEKDIGQTTLPGHLKNAIFSTCSIF